MLVVKDKEYINIMNQMSLCVLLISYNMFGKELVLEDGKITEVHGRGKSYVG